MTDLEAVVREVASTTGWPVEIEASCDHIRERVGARTVTAKQARDLCLAYAGTQGNAGAIDELLGVVSDVVKRIRWPGAEIADRRARLWEHVMDDDANGRVRLGTFDGRGPLAAWLRVVAARLAQRAAPRRDTEPATDDGLAAWWATAAAAEHDIIKDLYVDRVREAFSASVASLDEPTRVLLHLHYRRGVSLESLTKVYGVHRVTLSRRLAAARERLLDSAVATMTKNTAMTEHECRSLLRTLRSRLELSLGSLEGHGAQSTPHS
ncbi:MAG: hypothetical protein K0V04_40135 [Deltaproteobacteria bacterium]|nr:hypothetical protein [Deltaproteobacteria bacterium]